jgi:hypothetical protein
MDDFELDYGYQPNDIDSDIFLSEAPASLMKENIKAQFQDPLEHRKKDHMTTFLRMYQYSKENVDAYEDEDLDSLHELRDDFYVFMQRMFMDYLQLGFVNFDDMGEDEQDSLMHYTYRFFLINIKRNFVQFVLGYINKHRELFENEDNKRKDVTTMSFKKEITDPTDVYVLSNLYRIIDDILGNDDLDIDEFFELCDEDNSLETRLVQEAFNNDTITGNFLPHYIEMLDEDFKSEIESKVRNKILKKYRKK